MDTFDSLSIFSDKIRWTIFASNDGSNTTFTRSQFIWFDEKDDQGQPIITRVGATSESVPIVHSPKLRVGAAEVMMTYIKKTVRAKLRQNYGGLTSTGVLGNLRLEEELNEKSLGISEKPMTVEDGATRVKHGFQEAFAMFKLDGHRCLVMIKDEFLSSFTCDEKIVELIERTSNGDASPLVFRSRSGNVMTNNIHRCHMMNCMNIIRVVAKQLNYPDCGVFLDGELYIHGLSLQEVGKIVRAEVERDIGFHLFSAHARDCSTSFFDASFCVRKAIRFCHAKGMVNKNIVEVRTSQCRDVASKSLVEVFSDFLELARNDSFEGLIVYNKDGKYEFGKRVHSVLKLKFKEDDEGQILRFEHGEGKAKDSVFFIVSWNGHEVKIVAAGTIEQQQEDLKEFIASEEPRMYKFKFMGVTHDGKPRHAIGLGFRDKDDM